MSIKIGKGVPPPAKFCQVIKDLFQNEITNNINQTKTIFTFSLADLTVDQKASIIYPDGFSSVDVYLIYQIDTFDLEGTLLSSSDELISFVKKNDKFYYAFYYNIFAQTRIPVEELTKSHKAVSLSPIATFVTASYMELFNDINGTTTLLGLSTAIDNIYSSLQYSHKDLYYYEKLTVNGIAEVDLPKACLTGLSKNLKINF